MDAIVYVIYKENKYKENKTDSRRPESPDADVSVERTGVFGRGEDAFQIFRLTVRETVRESQSFPRRILSKCFPGIVRRRQQKKRDDTTRRIRQKLAPVLDEMSQNTCIYDGTCPWILPATGLPEFDGYLELKWIRRLLPYARNEHFLVLGSVPCIGQIFERIAPRMKSLMWVVPDYTYQAQAEALARTLSEEYGLIADLRFLPEGTVFSRVHIQGKYLTEPMNILDFTGEKYVPAMTPAQDSVWIDAAAVKEKARRIRGRGLAVQYVSLRALCEQKTFHETQYGS